MYSVVNERNRTPDRVGVLFPSVAPCCVYVVTYSVQWPRTPFSKRKYTFLEDSRLARVGATPRVQISEQAIAWAMRCVVCHLSHVSARLGTYVTGPFTSYVRLVDSAVCILLYDAILSVA